MIAASYTKYLQEVDSESSIVLVEDGLSINYLNGNKINTTGEEKIYTISVSNNSNETLHYYIEVDNIDSNKKNINVSKTTTRKVNNKTVSNEYADMIENNTDQFIKLLDNAQVDLNSINPEQRKIVKNK